MQNISGYGLTAIVRASTTFPGGFPVTQFADDADPFDTPTQTVGEAAVGLNGDLVAWNRANPLTLTLSVIPGGEDDLNLSALLEANRAARGKVPAGDVVTITAIYPSGRTVTLTQGIVTTGTPSDSVSSAGRIKSKSYSFAFENRAVTNI